MIENRSGGVVMSSTRTAEQDSLRRTLRQFTQRLAPQAELGRIITDGDEAAGSKIYRRMVAELGLPGVAVPERYGGAEGGIAELAIVVEELGRSLLPTPFFASVVLAVPVLLACSSEDVRRTYLPRLGAGELTATVSVSGRFTPGAHDDVVHARRSSSEFVLDGRQPFVLDAATADLIIVPGVVDDELHLFAVEPPAAGLSRVELPSLDLTRSIARLDLVSTPARRLTATAGEAERALASMQDIAATALAAEAVGTASACLDMAVDYAKARVQFGRPIGSFQAVKHKCVDMFYAAETSRCALAYAVEKVATEAADASIATGLAKAYCADAAFQCALDNIHVHGGVAYTWEHSAHLYYRRAKFLELHLGSPSWHRDRVIEELMRARPLGAAKAGSCAAELPSST
jgi:alkylation response protein AidB-like acyl-CoA dehydrogenase